jgi:2-polyprenyl-6-methoxyphenol hydroxylase-like FAD-dependent oxidoreductase
MTHSSQTATAAAQTSNRAVVIGGSLAGLSSAQVLAEFVDEVLIIERDTFADEPAPRKGVPQGRQLHQILLQGRRNLEELFPGIHTELFAKGATELDFVADAAWFNPVFGQGPRYKSDLMITVASRELVEFQMRQRVLANPRVKVLQGHDVVGLRYSTNEQRVDGVIVRERGENGQQSEYSADFVVDASGRESKASQWFEQLGFAAPAIESINAFVGYAGRYYKRTEDPQRDWRMIWILPSPPEIPRAAIAFPLEGDRWLVTLIGAAKDYPPHDEEGFLSFAQSLADPHIAQLITSAEPISPITSFRRTEAHFRHFERLDRVPDGFIVVGDANCSFNPFYGQGMTMAMAGPLLLREMLKKHKPRSGQHRFAGLAKPFFKKLARKNMVPWTLAAGIDSLYPTTEGLKRGLLSKLIFWYMNPMLVISSYNPEVYKRFVRVLHLLKSPLSLLHPSVFWAVIKHTFRSKPKSETQVVTDS